MSIPIFYPYQILLNAPREQNTMLQTKFAPLATHLFDLTRSSHFYRSMVVALTLGVTGSAFADDNANKKQNKMMLKPQKKWWWSAAEVVSVQSPKALHL